MKKFFKSLVTISLVLIMSIAFTACNSQEPNTEDLWANATYQKDETFGDGAKTLYVKVDAESKSVTFTIRTDKETVGEALLEHSLIAGDESEFGLYIKSVNGIKADYETDGAYWAFNKNGEYMMSGVDTTNFADGEQYELVYTKG